MKWYQKFQKICYYEFHRLQTQLQGAKWNGCTHGLWISDTKNTRNSYGMLLCYVEKASQAEENLTTKIDWSIGQNTRDQPELNQRRGLVGKTSYNTTSKWPPR